MKKGIYITFMSGALLLGLTACSDSSSNDTISSSKKTGSTQVQVEPQEPEMTIQEYSVESLPKIVEINESLDVLRTLSNEVVQDPSLLFDASFQDLIESTSTLFGLRIQAVKDIEAGNDPDVVAIHQLVLKAMDEFDFVATNFPIATKNLDTDLMEQCATHMRNGASYFDEATRKVQSITE